MRQFVIASYSVASLDMKLLALDDIEAQWEFILANPEHFGDMSEKNPLGRARYISDIVKPLRSKLKAKVKLDNWIAWGYQDWLCGVGFRILDELCDHYIDYGTAVKLSHINRRYIKLFKTNAKECSPGDFLKSIMALEMIPFRMYETSQGGFAILPDFVESRLPIMELQEGRKVTMREIINEGERGPDIPYLRLNDFI